MDAKIWQVMQSAIRSVTRSAPRPSRRPHYSDSLILRMYLWAVWHDRPMKWACSRDHNNSFYRPRALPSPSQFSRRLRTPRFRELLRALHERLAASNEPQRLAFLDGKPLPVSNASRDPDARVGWCTTGFAKGYRLHACVTNDRRIKSFCVTGMNDGEARIAREQLEIDPSVSIVMADANYDAGETYAKLSEAGHQLLTPLKRIATGRTAWDRMHPARRIVARMQLRSESQHRANLEPRKRIENVFSVLTCFGGGLAPLPAWVRTIKRVQRWVAAKISIYHARLRVMESEGKHA